MQERVFTPTEFSRLAGISSSTVHSLIAYGHVKLWHIGEEPRITESEILRFCDKKWKQITDPSYTGRKFRMFSPDEIRKHLKEF